MRTNMMSFVSEMAVSDVTSISMQSSILSMLTQTNSEVDRSSSVRFFFIRYFQVLILSFKTVYFSRTLS